MTRTTEPMTSTADREIVVSRDLNAPRELVWKAWSDPKHIAAWWGPNGFTTTTSEFKMVPGGVWRFVMHGPDGRDYDNRIVYSEVVEPERIVYKHGGEDDVEPVNFHVTVLFEERAGKTRLTMRMVFPSPEERQRVESTYGAVAGAIQTVGRLSEHVAGLANSSNAGLTLTLPSEREIVMTRVFNAPRRLVFEAHSKPEHLKKWWGCDSMSLAICEMDFTPGGAWRHVLRSPDGQEFAFKGVYREIVPPERLVYSFVFDADGLRDHEAIETLTFEEEDGKTIYTSTVLHQSVEARDGQLQSGMESGAAYSLDRLAELLGKMS